MDTQQKIINSNNIFTGNFLESKAFYMHCYQKAPCINWIDGVDTTRILQYIRKEYAPAITGIYQLAKYERKKRRSFFTTSLVLLNNNCMIELGSDYCEVLHDHKDYNTASQLIKEISRFKGKEKKKSFEINLIVRESYGLELKSMEVNRTKLNLGLYYEDSFAEVDRLIINRLNKKSDKGIVLLHGLPGTGKTTYLRYLIGRLKKKVLFLPPTMAESIVNPEFINLLVDNPNSIVIIEDAESVITDRKVNSNSSVSNLLNISDGLLADFLNVQVICTFNQPLTLVDHALMRKGRLIAQYEFAKLNIAKAQRLSNHFGFDTVITTPMTIAEIANQHEKEQKMTKPAVIGFRQFPERVDL